MFPEIVWLWLFGPTILTLNPGLLHHTDYLLEKSLSVIFVFVFLSTSFGILLVSQHQVLPWRFIPYGGQK
jgi:hypothetical protein